ncbi:MAG: DNA polymerase III subunit delta [Oscillospiraceae bacterium]|nr:DNA polymerase III subunit delta [Oscillospiraceae bacterium]
MPNITDNELVRSIKSGKILPAYFFWGKDIATLESIAKKLIAKLVPNDAKDMNYHFFSGSGFDISDFADACESLPMFADRVVVAVNDLNAESLKADDFKYILEILSGVDSDTTTVIFYATGIDLCAGKKALTSKNKKLCDHISKIGASCEFAFKRPNELVKYIQSRVGKDLCTISPKSAEYLASLCLCNLLIINNECDKLVSFVGKGEITDEVIDSLVSGQLDTDAYKLARAVTSGDRNLTFTILPELYAKQAESIPLLSVISGAFLDLYRAKLAYQTGRGLNNILEDYGYRGRDFAVKNALRDCSRISVEKLRACIQILSKCDIEMKSTRTDQRTLLETAISQMLSLR